MRLKPLFLAVSLAALSVNNIYGNSIQDVGSIDIIEIASSRVNSELALTTKDLPNINARVDKILIEHFTSAGITEPENIVVTVGIMREANIDVPSNAALLSADWLSRQTRPTTFEWTQMPLLSLAKMRAFGSSAPANRFYLAGAHRTGQPIFPTPSGGPTSVLLDKQGKRIEGHPEWPDIQVIEQAVQSTMDIKIEDHNLIDFSKIHWRQRYELPIGISLSSYASPPTRKEENTGNIAEERQQTRAGNGKIVGDTSDFKVWHIANPSVTFSSEATNAFLRASKNQKLDASDWAYMITAQIRGENTQAFSQYFSDQLLYSAQLAYRSMSVNYEQGELTQEDVSVIERFLNGDKDIEAFIPHMPARKNIAAITSKNHLLIADKKAAKYIWHFANGPKQGVHGGFTSKTDALSWYRDWVVNKGIRQSADHKGEVYHYYDVNFENAFVFSLSDFMYPSEPFPGANNGVIKQKLRETVKKLKLHAIRNGKKYGREMSDQFFKAARADIDSQFKQRNEQFAENLRYWFDFASSFAGIIGVGTSGKIAKALDFAVILGGVGVGGVTIANADNPSEKLEGIGAIIEATADTLESTGVGDRLSRKSSAIGSLFQGASTKVRQRLAQTESLSKPVPVVLQRKASVNLQNELNQIWNTPQPETIYQAKKLNIIKDDKQLEVILYQGKAYARFSNGYWFGFKLDVTSLDAHTIPSDGNSSNLSFESISQQAQDKFGDNVKVVTRKPNLEIITDIEIYLDEKNNKLEIYIPDQDSPHAISSLEDAEAHIYGYIQRRESLRQKIDKISTLRREVEQNLGNDITVLSQQPSSVDYEARLLIWPSAEANGTYQLYIPGEGKNFKTFTQLTEAKSLLASYRKNEFIFNSAWFLGDEVKVIDDVSKRQDSQYTVLFDANSSDQVTLYIPNSETPLSFDSFEETRDYLVQNNVVNRIKVNDVFLSSENINTLETRYKINISSLKLNGQEIALAYHKTAAVSDTFVLLAHGSGKEAIMFIKPEGLALDFATPANTILQSGGLGDDAFDLLNRLKENKVRYKHESQVYDISQIKMKDYSLSSSNIESHESIAHYISRQKNTDESTSQPNSSFTIINLNENALGLRLSDVIDALKETYGPNTPTKMICHFCRGEDNTAEIFDIKNNYISNSPLRMEHQESQSSYEARIEDILSENSSIEIIPKKEAGRIALERQQRILEQAAITVTDEESANLQLYSYDSNMFVNNFLRYGKEYSIPATFSNTFTFGETAAERVVDLAKIINKLPQSASDVLYRGGSGARGTSGVAFRVGALNKGNILVNTDFLSFTENPGVIRDFAGGEIGETGKQFDMTSIIFEIRHPQDAKVFAPFSWRNDAGEAESVYTPGNAFQIDNIRRTSTRFDGKEQPVVVVTISETSLPQPHVENDSLTPKITLGQGVYDFRTGELVDWGIFTSRYPIESISVE
ncbi:hypothetical protein [Spartinivicinus ruber]|uniref:hypothetical protein n=1 Tax=Spartinivicinus ruber TaxID=2683272 RepID=UPI0013D2E9CC|nr:hypothetical protein [Spartinivicinus ruber]